MKNVQTTCKSAHARNICIFLNGITVRGVELTMHTLVDVLVDRHSDTWSVNSILMHQSFVCPAPLGPGILGT